MQVQFHGAAGEVTGSCHLVEVGGHRVLLDCGMIQGNRQDEARNAAPFDFDAATIDAVVLSHAHIDHTGRLPLLVKRGFRGPIFTHPATIDVAAILLADSASIAQQDADRDNRHLAEGVAPTVPLYGTADVAATMQQMKPIEYRTPTEILPGVRVTLRDAGHILGSASIELTEAASARTLVFSGDLGPKGTPILCDPDPVPRADLVLMESTYGDRLHKSLTDTIAQLGQIFAQAIASQGNVVIPAFAVGRTQELLYFFAEHFQAWGLDKFKIFLDSPMASKVTATYDRHEDLFDAEAKALWANRPHPLRLPNLSFTDSVDQSRAINDIHGGAIIMAGSGMCNGGRIRHHLRNNLAGANNHIVFVGYQAKGTLGRLLVNGVASVKLFGEQVPVNAQCHTVGGLSAHADQGGLMDWYGAIAGHPPVWLVHGEDPARGVLAERLHAQFGATVNLSVPNKQIDV
ncbi:MAG: MBL fold metallo-hydrolase [Dokdonella sp.]